MAVQFFGEADQIEVANPPVLIFGQPGTGKTSLAQTADNPLTIDADNGAHRSMFRKSAVRCGTWADIVALQQNGLKKDGKWLVEPQFANFKTIIDDTVGTTLEYMTTMILASGMKGVRMGAGSLSQTGWGVLKTTFSTWLACLRQAGKQVILIAHQREEKNGEQRMLRPDIAGGSYGIVMNCADIVGYVSYRNGARHISWEPTDEYFAKNGARLPSGPIPDFALEPNWLGDLLTTARANLGHTAQASAEAAKAVEEWRVKLNADPTIDQLNAMLPDLSKLTNGTKKQVWNLILDRTKKAGLEFDKTAKKFTPKGAE